MEKEPLKSILGKVRCQRSWREMQSVKLPSRIWTGMRDSPTGRALAAEEEWLIRRTHESGSYNPLFPCESETVSTTKAIRTNRASSYRLIGAPTNGWKHPGRKLTQTCISEELQLRPKRSETEAIALLQSYSIHRCYWCFFMLSVLLVPARLQILPPTGSKSKKKKYQLTNNQPVYSALIVDKY